MFHLKIVAVALATSTAIMAMALAANERQQDPAGWSDRHQPSRQSRIN